jgi:iron(III) transport system permease protein
MLRSSPLKLILITAFFAAFMLYPLGHVLTRAFFLDNSPSLKFFSLMLGSSVYREIVLNSINLAISVTTLASLIAYPLAFILSRIRIPFNRLVHSLILAPLVVPPFVGVLGVRQLFSRFGSVNVALLELGIIDKPLHFLGQGNIIGIAMLQVIHLTPIIYLSIRASLSNTHTSLEEAAQLCGASRMRTLLRIALPLSIPGWFAGATLVFIASLTDLGTPLIFEYRNVLSVQIYNMLSDLQENPVGYAFVVSTSLLCIGIFMASQLVVFKGGYAGSGRSREGEVLRALPIWSTTLATTAVCSYALIATVPQLALILVALSEEWFISVLPKSYTLHHFQEVLHHKLTTRSLIISFVLSLAASILTLLVGFLTAHTVCRGRTRTKHLFEALSLIPLAIPGIVFAFGFIGAFSGTLLDNRINPFPLLIIAYAIRRLPAMVRTVTAGLQEASRTLEEAALMVGASPLKISYRITMPLIKRHLLAGAMLTFAYSMIEVSDSLLLALESKFYPVSKAIYALMGRPDGLEVGSALGVIVMLVMLVCFYLAERISKPAGRIKGSKTRAKVVSSVLSFITLTVPVYNVLGDSDELVVITPHWEGIRNELSGGFSKYWKERTGRDVAFRWLDIGGTSDIVKYITSQFKDSPDGIGIDLFFGGGPDSFIELAPRGVLAQVDLPSEVIGAIPQSLSGMLLYSPDKLWFANAINTFGLLYNRIALKMLELPEPKSWADLARPEFLDLVGAGDPRKSGSMHAMFEIILQGYGWERGWQIIQQIARNVRNFTSSASQIGKEVATAEVVYGLAIDTYAGDIIRQVGDERIGYHLPEDFAAFNPDCIAMLKGAPHREAARAFIEFNLSEAGQKIWHTKIGTPGGPAGFEIGKLSVLPKLYNSPNESASIVKVDPFKLPNLLPYDSELAAKRWNLFNDLFGVFIIDQHDRLTKISDPGLLLGIPISEATALSLTANGEWGRDPSLRNEHLAEWARLAARELPGGGQGILDLKKWIPLGLIAGSIILSIIRRRLWL